MRTTLLLGLIAGADVWEFIHGPETDVTTQRAEFKRLRGQREHDRYAVVELWDSGSGRIGRHRFGRSPAAPGSPAPEPAPPAVPPEPVSAAPAEVTPTEPETDAAGDFEVPKAPKRRRASG